MRFLRTRTPGVASSAQGLSESCRQDVGQSCIVPRAWRPVSKLTHTAVGGRLLFVAIAASLDGCLQDAASGFPPSKGWEREIWNGSDIASLCHMPLVTQTNLSTLWEGTTRECAYQQAGIIGSCPIHKSYGNGVVLAQEETNRPTEVQRFRNRPRYTWEFSLC